MNVKKVSEPKYSLELNEREFLLVTAAVGQTSGGEAQKLLISKGIKNIDNTEASNILSDIYDDLTEELGWYGPDCH